MDINNLKAFIEVADKKSFSRSAESLKLTQPAVSKRIAALEAELSAKLFDRVGRSVHLTEAGQVLLPSARQISLELSRIEDVICNLGKDVSGTLSIGTTEHIGTHRLPGALKPFREQYPNVNIDLRFASSQETLNNVEEGLLEVALCSLSGSQKLSPKLHSTEVWSDKMVIAVANDHPLATDHALESSDDISLELLLKCPAVLPRPKSATRRKIDTVLQANNLAPLVSIEANDFETIRTMASIGFGWACLPEFQIDESLTVLTVKELQLKFSTLLVMHHERTLSRAAQAFIESLPTDQSAG